MIMKKHKRTWIVVADGGQARILTCEAGLAGLQQPPNSSFSDPQLPTHEMVTDRQPSVRRPMGKTSHAVGPKSDPHKQRKMQFTKDLFGHIEQAAKSGAFEHLIIVAPPSVLGEIRKDLSPGLQRLLHAEYAHDYVHQSNDYIYEQLKDSLPN
jgi:protein required for attachment to host cells